MMKDTDATMMVAKAAIDANGFAVLKSVIDEQQIESLCATVDSLLAGHAGPLPGLRHLLTRSPELRNFAETTGSALASQFLPSLRPVRCILFDKTPAANWYVTWHQDRTIPVRRRVDVPGFGPWSIKDDIQHVQPPASVLENMLSLRFHLDDNDAETGAIKFIAGSHNHGLLEPEQIAGWRDSHGHHLQTAGRGDVIVMRPLILHASSEATNPTRRRVVHIEFAGCDLPGGLEWGLS
jgi:ectoine hydroxylase-related dioxygenase (phytanoyl-CoA dioxygenase family)